MEIKLGGSELENGYMTFKPFENSPSATAQGTMKENGMRNFVTNVARCSVSSWSHETIARSARLPHGSALLAESDLPAPIHSHHAGIPENLFECGGDSPINFQDSLLESIPTEISRILLNIYLRKILPHDPFLFEDDLTKLYHQIYDVDVSSSGKDPTAIFIISMVLAIVVSM